ncbi:MAG: MFS transporter [Promethearchaeota archaeon]
MKKRKRILVPDHHKFTSDFDSVIFIVLWNSLGFFFIEFIMTYYIFQVLVSPAYNVGIYFSAITIGGLISSIFIGYLTDRFSKKLLVMIGAFGRGFSYFGLYIAIIMESLIGMYISAFLLGLGAYIFWNPLDTIISEKSSKHHRSSAFGKRRFALGIGMALGTVIGFLIFIISTFLTPGNAFLIFGAIPIFGISNIIAGIRFSRNVDENKKFEYPQNDIENEVNSELEMTDEYSKKSLNIVYYFSILILFTGFFLTAINFGLYRPYILTYVLTYISDKPVLVAFFYLPASLIGTLIAPKLGTIADRLNTYLTIAIASFLGGIVTWLIIYSRDLWIFAILLIIDNTIMLTVSFVFVNFLSRVSIKHRGKIFGIISLFENIGMIIGPVLGGIVWETISPQAPFIISIIVEWSLIPFFIIGMKLMSPNLSESIKDKKERNKN